MPTFSFASFWKDIRGRVDKYSKLKNFPFLVDDNSISWVGSDRDYTYEELLNRAFEIMRDKNPDMAAGKKQKFVMRPPQVTNFLSLWDCLFLMLFNDLVSNDMLTF